MESLLWPALYPLRANPVLAGISLGCGIGLKVPPTVGAHSGPPRGLDKKIIIINWREKKKGNKITRKRGEKL